MMKSIFVVLMMTLSCGFIASVPLDAFAATDAQIPVSTEDLAAPAELKVEAPANAAAGDTSMEEAALQAVESAAPKAEADIPVTLDSKVVSKTSESSLRDLVLAVALLGGFGLFAWLALNKFRSRNPKTAQFQMKVLAQHHLGPKKSLMVVRVAGESVLLGVTDHNINMLKSLALLDEDLPQDEVPSNFQGVLTQKNSADSVEAKAEGPTSLKKESAPSRFSFRKKSEETTSEGEDFAISKIRDVVHRQVRNLKSLE